MNTYLVKPCCTMKEYNRDKWFIMSDIMKEREIAADSVNECLALFRELAYNESYITISKSAIKNKRPMYIDTAAGVKQVGFVLTGLTEFEDRDNRKYSKQYIDIWLTIQLVHNPFDTEGSRA